MARQLQRRGKYIDIFKDLSLYILSPFDRFQRILGETIGLSKESAGWYITQNSIHAAVSIFIIRVELFNILGVVHLFRHREIQRSYSLLCVMLLEP